MSFRKLAPAALLFGAFLLGTSAGAAQLAVNGGLETGDTTGWELFPTPPPSSAGVTTDNPSSGTYSLNVNNQTEASSFVVKQANVGEGLLTPGQEVTISFDIRGSAGVGGVVFAEVFSEIAGGGVSLSEILGGGPLFPTTDWVNYMFTTTLGPDVSGGMTLQFAAVTGAVMGSFVDLYIDNVSIEAAVVPVPAAVWFMASALGLLGFGRRFSS